jgi:UDP-N-acetylglucosamine:LPS N-acetylglucosamine transferase
VNRGAAMPCIDLVYLNAGGGHRAAALALREAIQAQGRPWQVRLVDLVDVLDPSGQFRRITGIAPEDIYNKRLARGWTIGLAQELRLLQGLIRWGHARLVQRLRSHWLRTEPDLVVSLIPNFNRALYDSVASALPGVACVTVLTDMADHPPAFWIEAPQGQHLVCGTERAMAQARAMGHDEAHLHRVSGMILRPDFYRPPEADRAAQRLRLGLDPDRPTGVVMFGGQGSMSMLTIARQLADVQLVLMAGHHRALASRLRALEGGAPRAVVEFTPEVRRHLQLGDFFIGKPGPGSLSEAVQLGLPVITVRNAWTLPQERYNTEWVQANGLGLVATSTRRIGPAVAELLAGLDAFKARVAGVENRAVFEVPEILARVLDVDRASMARARAPRYPGAAALAPGRGRPMRPPATRKAGRTGEPV